jgi:hypothetical protein
VAALLRCANAGPEDEEKPKMSKRDRRVAARTRAASSLSGKQDQPESGGPRNRTRAARSMVWCFHALAGRAVHGDDHWLQGIKIAGAALGYRRSFARTVET